MPAQTSIISALPELSEAASIAIHPGADRVDAAAAEWASRMGLISGESGRDRLLRDRFGRLPARMFPKAPQSLVALSTQWLIWLFSVDDLQDEHAASEDPGMMKDLYERFVQILRRDPQTTGVEPHERALEDLWSRTGPRMSPQWRDRFIDDLTKHGAAFAQEANYRQDHQIPTPGEFLDLRRHANGMFMWDLIEVVLRTEIPGSLVEDGLWGTLCDASNDVTAWRNDIASLVREADCGDVNNYVLVLSRALDCSRDTATQAVNSLIARRMQDLCGAECALLDEAAKLSIPRPRLDAVAAVAEVVRLMPAAHLLWLVESGRYPADGT